MKTPPCNLAGPRSRRPRRAPCPAIAGALLLTCAAEGQIQPGAYTCTTNLARTNNFSLAITHRTLTCGSPTGIIHYWDLSTDPDLAGQYTTIRCMDWSLWSSSNPGEQTIYVRVWQDMAPGRDQTINCAAQIDESHPGPSAGGAVLLREFLEIFPPSTEGVDDGAPPRPDGDRSTVMHDFSGGLGLQLPPDARFYIELFHLGEAITRFGANQAGEAGDGDSADPRVTWYRAQNCSGGGCFAGQCAGDPACSANPIIKWSEFAPAAVNDRDVVMQAHLKPGSPEPSMCSGLCPADFPAPPKGQCDREVNVNDLLVLLSHWGETAPPRPIGDIAPPPNGDNTVNVSDLLLLLGEWGPCKPAYRFCERAIDPDNPGAKITADGAYSFELDGFLDGPQRGPTNDINVVVSGPTTCGWADFGTDGIPGGFRFGDVFGINPSIYFISGIPPGTIGGDAWFLYTASCSGTVFLETTASCPIGAAALDDSLIEIYPGEFCPTDWTDILACDDGSGTITPCGDHARASLGVLPGESYLIRIGGWLGEQGEGVLHVSCIDNSTFENAIDLTINAPITGSTIGVPTATAPDCDDVDVNAPGRWYRIVGDGSAFFEASTCGTQVIFDTRLSIYTSADGTAAGLTCIAAANSDTCGLGETVSWPTAAGTTYYILVHGTAGVPPPFVSEGSFVIEVRWP